MIDTAPGKIIQIESADDFYILGSGGIGNFGHDLIPTNGWAWSTRKAKEVLPINTLKVKPKGYKSQHFEETLFDAIKHFFTGGNYD